MKCPTKEQIKEAASISVQVRNALVTLFPDVFEKPVYPGQLYSWGTDNDGDGGVIAWYPDASIFHGYQFINFRTGVVYVSRINSGSTPSDLAEIMLREQHNGNKKFCKYFDGKLKGPKQFRSWCVK